MLYIWHAYSVPMESSVVSRGTIVHYTKGQRPPTYRFNLRVLLQDWIGTESWLSVFDSLAVKVLGFTANAYVAMTSDDERVAALSVLRGVRVRATIKKRINKDYVNYTASELEVLDEPFSL